MSILSPLTPLLRALACSLWLLGIATSFAAPGDESRPFLHPLFADGMVLQRDRPNPVWGWTTAGETVRVGVGSRTVETRAAPDGRWEVAIEPPPTGGPYELTIDGPEQLVLRDVLVGDVWLCSGQSNMAFALRSAQGGNEEIARADFPRIRLFAVENRSAYSPATTPRGSWRSCSPATAGQFSAVAYFFARRLQAELGVPIGLIQAAVGGSPAESWMSETAVAHTAEFNPQLEALAELRASDAPPLGSFLMHWLARYDAGDRDAAWAQPDFADDGWTITNLSHGFSTLGVPTTPAVCWFRTVIELPNPLPAGAARLQLGQVEKMDTAYLNGRWIGASSWVENPRNYAIPAGVLKPGRNVVALRVFKSKPAGGFLDGPSAVRLTFGEGSDATVIPLAGDWRAKLSVDARPPHPLPLDWENYPTMPTVLYQGMIAPLAPFALTGALWYQGEANFTRAEQYRQLLPALIADWRATFRNPELPVYVVSLPGFMARRMQPGTTDGWAELRAVQLATARTVPHTAAVVTLDVGDAADIHPVQKRPIGERLAACALADHYGRKTVFRGPTFARAEKLRGGLRVHFDHADQGLVARGETLGEFSVAGEDRVWHWAEARVDGDTVLVSSPEVPEPIAVRYAWQANPLATLFNGAGFPAEPFNFLP